MIVGREGDVMGNSLNMFALKHVAQYLYIFFI